MSSFAKQTRFLASAFRRPVIITGTVKAEALSQKDLSSLVWIRNFGALVWLVISAVAINTSTITRRARVI